MMVYRYSPSNDSTAVPGQYVGAYRYYVATICPRCGNNHTLEQCPQVESIEYYEDGKIKRVNFRERNPFGPPYDITLTVASTSKPGDLQDWVTF